MLTGAPKIGVWRVFHSQHLKQYQRHPKTALLCAEIHHVTYLYIKIGLSLCVTTGVAWMDGRSRAAGARQAQTASGELC